MTVTPPIFADAGNTDFPAFAASGQSVQTLKTVTSKKVSTPKSAKTKKNAKKKYTKRIKAAKNEVRPGTEEGRPQHDEEAGCQAVVPPQAGCAKASYKKSVARYKIVRKTSTKRTSTAFDLNATYRAP